MIHKITSIFSVLAFIIGCYAAYTSHQNQTELGSYNPLAVISYVEIGAAITESAVTEEETNLKYDLLKKQITRLQEAGIVVFDSNGKMISFPDSIYVSPEQLGLTGNEDGF